MINEFKIGIATILGRTEGPSAAELSLREAGAG